MILQFPHLFYSSFDLLTLMYITSLVMVSTGKICLRADDATVEAPVQEMVEFTIIYNKQKYEVKFALDETVDALKNHIEKLTGNHTVSCLLCSC